MLDKLYVAILYFSTPEMFCGQRNFKVNVSNDWIFTFWRCTVAIILFFPKSWMSMNLSFILWTKSTQSLYFMVMLKKSLFFWMNFCPFPSCSALYIRFPNYCTQSLCRITKGSFLNLPLVLLREGGGSEWRFSHFCYCQRGEQKPRCERGW